MFVPVNPFPYYIKKEDAKDILKSKKRSLTIIPLAFAFVIVVMLLFIHPKLNVLYSDFNYPKPFLTEIAPYTGGLIIIVLLVFAWYVNTSPNLDQEFQKRLSKYKTGEMIKTKDLLGLNYEWVLFIMLALIVGFLIVSIILPIYGITSSL